MTPAQFLASFPEFESASQSLITAKLLEAGATCGVDAYGSTVSVAVGYYAAHLLWTSPFGVSMRLDGNGEDIPSRYLLELERLRLAVVPRIIVL